MHKYYDKIREFIFAIVFCCVTSWKASRSYTIIRVLFSLFDPVGRLLCAYFMKNIINLLFESRNIFPKTDLFIWIFLWGIIYLGIFICQKSNQYVSNVHNRFLERYLKKTILDKSLQTDLEAFDNPAFFDDFDVSTRNPQSLQQIVSYTITTASSALSFVGVFLMALSHNPIYALLVIIPIVPKFIIEWKFTQRFHNLEIQQAKTHRKANYIYSIGTNSDFAFSVRTHCMEQKIVSEFDFHFSNLIDQWKGIAKKQSEYSIFSEIPICLTLVILAIDLAQKTADGKYTIGDFSFIINLLIQLWNELSAIVYSIAGLYKCKLKVNVYQKFQSSNHSRIKAGSLKLGKVDSIEFSHVFFRYSGTQKFALEDVSFTINHGHSVAMIGFNGSGKSTIIKLLMRLYEQTSGEILINNFPIEYYDLGSLRHAICVYQQNEPIFQFSIRDNVDLFSQAENDEAIFSSIRKANALKFIENIPNGLNTFLGRTFESSGIELSGGGKQRIALARLFCSNGSALVFDEPFSSLDPVATSNILEEFRHLKKNKIILYTAHTLTSVLKADMIIILEDGKVVEIGSVEELLSCHGKLSKWFHLEREESLCGYHEMQGENNVKNNDY